MQSENTMELIKIQKEITVELNSLSASSKNIRFKQKLKKAKKLAEQMNNSFEEGYFDDWSYGELTRALIKIRISAAKVNYS